MDHHNRMRRLVSLGLCFTVSLVLVFGSVLSHTDMNMALAVDMPDAPVTQDTITAGSGGDDGDQGDNDQEDDPVTQDTITAGGGSEEDNDEDNPGQNGDNNDNNDNKNEPTTTDTKVTNKPNCPKDQERPLFEAACKPIQGQVNDCGNDPDPLSIFCSNTGSQIQGEENAAALTSEATKQVNDCEKDLDPLNVGCQNTASQIQGDYNTPALTGEQD